MIKEIFIYLKKIVIIINNINLCIKCNLIINALIIYLKIVIAARTLVFNILLYFVIFKSQILIISFFLVFYIIIVLIMK